MSAYSAAVLADNPFHYWRCNDSPGGYLQDQRAVTPRPLIAQGQQIGSGYSGPVSDGGACMVDANFGFAYYDTEVLTNPLSAECWFWQAYYQALVQHILTINTAAGASTAVIRTTATGALQTFGSAATFTGGAPIASSHWHHCVLTFDGANMRTYLDGALVGTTANGAFSQASRYIVGTAAANATPMAGSVSEIALYASTLSAARVSAHFAAADQIGQNPTNGSQQVSAGVTPPPPFGPSLQAILNAVQRTFPTT
jgi:hypothetical protein